MIDKYDVSTNGDTLSIDLPEGAGDSEWRARSFGKSVLVEPNENTSPETQGKYSSELFKALLDGLLDAKWSGLVIVNTPSGAQKKIYFSDGLLVFAGSDQIDDRLGEVIYREQIISLDELTDSAARVTMKNKFGQVLLNSNVFDNADLWRALKLQVISIVRSVFMAEHLFVELDPGASLPPTEVSFLGCPKDLIAGCYSYGKIRRDFLQGVTAETRIELMKDDSGVPGEGSFLGDFASLVRQEPKLLQLIEKSNLTSFYSCSAIMELCKSGVCSITNASRAPVSLPIQMREAVDAFNHIFTEVKGMYKARNATFPASEVQKFVDELCDGDDKMFLYQDGSLAREWLIESATNVRIYKDGGERYCRHLQAYGRFLLQLAGDNLDWGAAKQLRAEYQNILAK